MISKAYQDHYDIALLIAGDEDHLPVVEAVKNTGKRVYGAFFEGTVSQNLKESFDMPFILSQEWLVDRKIKAMASILEFQFPDEIKRGEEAEIFTNIKGSLNNGFLELLIIDSKNNRDSHPDPKSYNSKLNFVKETHSSTWKVPIPNNIEKGTCRAYLRLYENISPGNILTIDSKEKVFIFT